MTRGQNEDRHMHTHTHTNPRSTLAALGVVSGSLLLAASAITCGGGSGGSCGVQPCGGSVVGSWRASSACADQATANMEFLGALASSCPSATLSTVSYMPSGTLMFGSSMTYTADVKMAISFTMNLPASCLQGQSCAEVNAAIQATVGTDGITSAACSGSGSCTCAVAGTVDVENSAGTYATAGTTLTLTATSGGNGDSGPYCVQGSTLHLVSVDMSMAMAKITGDIVLNKQ
jgi:hypothetical protein